jgi:hypothetical protein
MLINGNQKSLYCGRWQFDDYAGSHPPATMIDNDWGQV